ncbi:hypothetical protein ACH40F_54355 [Streptomyces sp. NPDC020794]|uniref:hypothetical protein n=1 Tax=unclassified Streptomyces TaxID=2593676 RepID=UPI0036E4AD10
MWKRPPITVLTCGSIQRCPATRVNDPANETGAWIITSSRPGRGNQVSLSTRITLELRAPGEG